MVKMLGTQCIKGCEVWGYGVREDQVFVCSKHGQQTIGFQNYIEENLTGQPIEITGPAHRDALLAQHKATYDKASQPSKGEALRELQKAVDKVSLPMVDYYRRNGLLDNES